MLSMEEQWYRNEAALHANQLKGGGTLAFDTTEQSELDDVLSVAEPLQQFPCLLSPNSISSDNSKDSRKAVFQKFLQTVPHLYTLSMEQIAGLDVMVREYGEMNVIIEEGFLLKHVYVLASGTVEVINSKKGLKQSFGHRRIGTIKAPSIFGIDDAIIETPSAFTYHASSNTALLLIPKQQFIALFADSPIFANSVSCQLLQTLPGFAVFQEFCRNIFGSSVGARGSSHHGHMLSLPSILRIFKSSRTVFHKYVHSNEIDTEALRYCVRRLPTNITETYVILLTMSLPHFISNEFMADAITGGHSGTPGDSNGATTMAVDTGKRRRCAWTFNGGGQTVVMMRDGFTDIIDFVSNLCMYTIETRKLHTRLMRLVSPTAVQLLRSAFTQMEEGREWEGVFSSLGLSAREVDALHGLWGDDTLRQLYNIILHREEYVVHIESTSARRFTEDAYANWCLTILRHVKQSLGLSEEEDLPSNVVIDVLFSPNRTFKNLFCSMASDFSEIVCRIGSDEEYRNPSWRNDNDRYYYILAGLLERESTLRDAYRARLESNGFTLMEDSHSSALIVDLVDVSKICPSDTDPALQQGAKAAKAKAATSGGHFIINVDKTFGAQIETVLRSLLLTFGDRIRSVNLTGKTAGLTGNRGDIVLPSKLLFLKQYFGEDSTDEIRLCNREVLESDVTALTESSNNATIHRGTCITVPGFVLQSRPVLKFYKLVHGCTALDMQSSYVSRQLEECRRTGVLSRRIISRYLFYCDDMPLGNEDGSELRPRKREIISTIYATARSILSRILQAEE